MPLMLSKDAIRSMGFAEIDPACPITASFFYFSVAQVVGLTVDSSDLVHHVVPCEFGLPTIMHLGNSLDKIAAASEFFVHDEEAWQKEHKAEPPYLVIVIGPTEPYTARDGWWKEDGEFRLVTYGTFDTAKEALRTRAEKVVTRLHTTLTIHYSQQPHPIKLRSITSKITGRMADGKAIQDVRMQSLGYGSISSRISVAELSTLTYEAIQRLPFINFRIAEFVYNGEVEEDNVKRFLYYFVAIEIGTHRAFKGTDKSSTSILSSDIPAHIKHQGSQLLQKQYADLKALADRFVWCAIVAWSNVTDADVLEMMRLKKIRDDIAHGNVITVRSEDAEAARSLALLILRESASLAYEGASLPSQPPATKDGSPLS